MTTATLSHSPSSVTASGESRPTRDPFVPGLMVHSDRHERAAIQYRHGEIARGLYWLAARLFCLLACLLVGATVFQQLEGGRIDYIRSLTNASAAGALALLGVWAHLHSSMRARELAPGGGGRL